ncbi:MAG: hypothetical protein ACRCVT_00715 [Leadbetterella sp.]
MIKILRISIFVLLFSSCKDKDIKPDPNAIRIADKYLVPVDEGTFDNVELRPNTQNIALETMSSLKSESNGLMTFSSTNEDLKNLKTGSVVLFEGYDLKKIVSVKENKGEIQVQTTPAKFGDYFKSASLRYEDKIVFNKNTVRNAKINMGGRIASPTEIEGTQDVSFEGTIQGWEVSLKFTPSGGDAGQRLELELEAKKDRLAKIEVQGFISNFSSGSNLDVQNSRIDRYAVNHNDMNGELEMKYTFLTLDQVATFEIPMEFERTILVNGVVPVTFKLKCALKIFPEVATNSTCQANMKLAYNGSQGFDYNGSAFTPNGSIGGFDVALTGENGSASAGIVGVGVGLEFPRVSIGIFGDLIVPYMVNNTSVIAYFESGLPFVPGPCNQTKLSLKGSVGVNLSLLGLANATFERELYSRERIFETPGSRCPDSFFNNNIYSDLSKSLYHL